MGRYVDLIREWNQSKGFERVQKPTCEVMPGLVVRIFPRRPSCVEAGHCLQLTREIDCELFPLTSGPWCRERPARNYYEGRG